jgi:DNA alkylation damage repair protein AlkB
MPTLSQPALPAGIRYLPDYFDRAAQAALVDDIRGIVEAAPLYTPAMPKTGKEMSVRMTNCGELGWVTDKERGYRYQPTHPITGEPWPPVPQMLLDLWRAVADHPQPPQACLVNFYSDKAKMGLHQDRDESDFSAPVVSVSLGDDCLFRVRDAILPSAFGRRRRARRRRQARLPRRRPHLFLDIDASEERRPDQFDAAAGDEVSRSPAAGWGRTVILADEDAHRPAFDQGAIGLKERRQPVMVRHCLLPEDVVVLRENNVRTRSSSERLSAMYPLAIAR